MKTLQEVLAGDGCGVYRCEGDSANALSRMAGRAPCHVRIQAPPGKQALLEVLAAALQFPAHFGVNWDALYDCLTDLDQAREPGVVVEIHGLGKFARAAPGELSRAIETFSDTARFWRERSGRFLVLLGGAGRVAAELPALDAG
jgi:hypothetical protein